MGENFLLKRGTETNVSGQKSTLRPSVAVFNGKLYEVHHENKTGKDRQMYCTCMGDNKDPNKWDKHNSTTNWKTDARPTVTVFKNRMFMAWKGGNNRTIYYAHLDKKNNWQSSKSIKKPAGAGNDIVTDHSPVIVKFFDSKKKPQLYMFYLEYRDKGDRYISFMKLDQETEGAGDDVWLPPHTAPGTWFQSKMPPSVAVKGSFTYVAFLNLDGFVQVCRMDVNGFVSAPWTVAPDGKSGETPELFNYNGSLYVSWNSTSKKYTLVSRMIILSDGATVWSAPEPIFSDKTQKPITGTDAYCLPSYAEKFRGGLFGVWRENDGQLKFANFAAMKIEHVFVLMMENRSFDHMLGFSGIPGADTLKGDESNTYKGKKYTVTNDAPFSMDSDPGHEFPDAYEQLCGDGATFTRGNAYPNGSKINNSGFAANFAKGKHVSEKTYGYNMKCYSPENLPVLNQLAREFVLCDKWFSSLPGPTAPNRFFSLAASSAGIDYTPNGLLLADWMGIADAVIAASAPGAVAAGIAIADPISAATGLAIGAVVAGLYVGKKLYQGARYHTMYNGLTLKNGSIFGRIKYPKSKIFIDYNGHAEGKLPMSLCMQEVRWTHYDELGVLFTALEKNNYSSAFTLIEPNYGHAFGSFKGGTSQHPVDDVRSGEKLIKSVYENLRKWKKWENSLLIITYDEHGGFYDHVAPPAAVHPGDADSKSYYNSSSGNGFQFDRLGVRVPAIVVSPWVKQGKVDHTVYDHSSIAATLTSLFGMQPLTNRDRNAKNVTELLELDEARTDCPLTLNNVPEDAKKKSTSAKSTLAADKKARKTLSAAPLPATSNGLIVLFNAMKIHHELGKLSDEKLLERISKLDTIGKADKFISEAVKMVEARRRNR